MRFIVVVVALALSACGAWQSVSDKTSDTYRAVFYKQVKTLNVDFTARASLNPDEADRPVSVAVRVYQLKDRKSFDAASYDDLLKNDRTALGGDLQDAAGVVVNPGSAASLSQPMRADTQYVAIVAFFRDVRNERDWRRVIAKKSMPADAPLKFELIDRELISSSDSR
ncbi:type VI secretion system lipoprotein TssJ [Caballeronia humi]|uniref:Lipoprotein n=1 Tax=Caballeronia humi TaxID=326474 RepID=A0A158GLM5_9BURK|nr:type VI secretion system lipoprotein TssJ [Caballeronia humi]SAL33014.1 lipoprotein [Caballeronia humi]